MGISPGALHAESTPRNTCMTAFDPWLPGLLASCSYTPNGPDTRAGGPKQRDPGRPPGHTVCTGRRTDRPPPAPSTPQRPWVAGLPGEDALRPRRCSGPASCRRHTLGMPPPPPHPPDGLLTPWGGDRAPFSRRRSRSFRCGLGVLSSWSTKAVHEAIDLKDNITCFQSL